jgi:flagellar motor switch protein FliM
MAETTQKEKTEAQAPASRPAVNNPSAAAGSPSTAETATPQSAAAEEKPAKADSPATVAAKADRPSGSKKAVRTYDFRRPKYLSAEQMKNLNRIHSGVADLIRERLTRFMGADVDVRAEGGEEVAFGLLAESIPEHTYTVLLDLAPLQDRGLLLLDSQLCLSFVDRILGGRSKTPTAPRSLTSIDQAAAEGVIEMILRAFREGWKDFCPAKMGAMDRRPEFDQVQFVTAGEPVLTAALRLKGDLGEGRIRICVPVAGLKAMVAGDSARAAVRPGPEKAAAIRAALNETLEQASLPITVTVGVADVSLRNLLKLGVGDIVRLGQPAEEPVLLSIGGRPAFLVRMGLRGRAKAVQIVERLQRLSSDG